MHIDACIICVVADDGAAVYRQVSAHIDTCFIIARGGQTAGAGDGQIAVHVDAGVKLVASGRGSALQHDVQVTIGIDAVGSAIDRVALRDYSIAQRQGVRVFVVRRVAAVFAALYCIRVVQHIHAVHPQLCQS